MSSSARTQRNVRATSDMIKNSQLTIAMWLIARYADHQCERFTALFQRTLRAVASTAPILNSYAHLWISRVRHALNAQVIHIFDRRAILQARAHKGAHTAPLKRIAQWVALGFVGALCLPMGHADGGSIEAIKSIRLLADYQLTEKQEYCHNSIVYRESRFNSKAINGSHIGYYQGRSKALLNASDDYQFYWYWSYVSHRYGITQYDEPNYCKALHHLRVKGWQ